MGNINIVSTGKYLVINPEGSEDYIIVDGLRYFDIKNQDE